MNANIRFLVKVLKWSANREGGALLDYEAHRYEALKIYCEDMFNSTSILTDIVTPELLAAQLSKNIEKHFFRSGERESGTNEEKVLYEGVCGILNKFVEECKAVS